MRKSLFTIVLLIAAMQVAFAFQFDPESQLSIWAAELIGQHFLSLAIFTGASTTVTGLLINWIHPESGNQIWKTIAGLIVALGMSAVGWAFQMGIFSGLTFIAAMQVGWSVGAGSIALFTIIKQIGFIEVIKGLFTSKA